MYSYRLPSVVHLLPATSVTRYILQRLLRQAVLRNFVKSVTNELIFIFVIFKFIKRHLKYDSKSKSQFRNKTKTISGKKQFQITIWNQLILNRTQHR